MDLRNDLIAPVSPAGRLPPEEAAAPGQGDGADAAAFEAALARAVDGLAGRQALAAARALPPAADPAPVPTADESPDAQGGGGREATEAAAAGTRGTVDTEGSGDTASAADGSAAQAAVQGEVLPGYAASAAMPGTPEALPRPVAILAGEADLALARAAVPATGPLTGPALPWERPPASARPALPAEAAPEVLPTAPPTRLTADGLPLREVALGQTMRLITPAEPDPDTASLVRFARANGFDETAVRQLFGADAPLPAEPAARAVPAAWMLPSGAATAGVRGVPSDAAAMSVPGAGSNPAVAAAGVRMPSATVPFAPEPAPMAAWVLAARAEAAGAGSGPRGRAGGGPEGGAVARAAGALDTAPVDLSTPPAPGATSSSIEPAEPAELPRALVVAPVEQSAAGSPAPSVGDPAEGAPAFVVRLPELQHSGLPEATGAPAAFGPGTEAFEEASRRLADAVAQRVAAEVRRGNWDLAFALDPPELGRVEVSLQMRAGELDARLVAQHGMARDLLQEALPRLREGLLQSGMDVAQLQVGLGLQARSGGNPTPGGRRAEPSAAAAASGDEVDAVVPVGERARGHEGGTVDFWA
jgi:flagellar hook-length control protein FliK